MEPIDSATLITKIQEFIEKTCLEELLERIRLGNKSIKISFPTLALFDPQLADYLLDLPEEFLKGAELAVESINPGIKGFILRFRELPPSAIHMIRNIRSVHLNKLLGFDGVVRNKSEVRPQMTSARFECPSCGNTHTILQINNQFQEPTRCSCGRKGKFRLVGKELVDAQMMVLEEVPEQLEGGEQPKRMNVLLKSDLVSPLTEKKTNPGARVHVVGQVKEVPIFLRTGGQSTKFDLIIDADNLESVGEDYSEISISPEEKAEIEGLSKDPQLMKKIINSIAPSIYGHEKTKEALALQLAGGVRKKRDDGIITRGDIHILLVGDPGAAKSQLLKRMQFVAPKARYVTGKGASLDFEEPLLIRKNGVIQHVPIGKFVDDNYISEMEDLLVPLKENVETLALNHENYKLEWKQIKYVYRHSVKEKLLRFNLETGRTISTTGDHSIFVLINGKSAAVPANSLKIGDCVIIPKNIHNTANYSLSVEAARLLGYYIAEGHIRSKDSSYKIEFTVHKNEKEIIEDIIHCSKIVLGKEACVYPHGENGARAVIYGKKAYALFSFLLGEVAGKKAKEKRIPLCILNAQQEAKKAFIETYIAGDAGVTKSPLLMSDLLYLYLQDGIIASCQIREDTKTTTIKNRLVNSTGLRYDLKSPQKGKKYSALYTNPPFSAIPQSTIKSFFREAISSGYSRARLPCAENKLLLQRLLETSKKSLLGKDFRKTFGECTLEYVNDHSDLFTLQKTGREVLVGITEKGKEALEGLECLSKLMNSDLGFARIKSIEKVQSTSKYVYDVSVPGFESFVGGFGGVLCHNSGAGLSAAVVKDEFLQGWSLEAGALVLANKGLCVTGDTQVLLADGKIIRIDALHDLFNKGKQFTVQSLDTKTFGITKQKVVNVSVRTPEKLLELTSDTGDVLRITPEHPIPSWNNGLKWMPAGEIQEKTKILLPTEFISASNQGQSALLELCGMISTDGHLSKKKYQISYYSKNEFLTSRFKELIKKCFGKEARTYEDSRRGVIHSYINSKEVHHKLATFVPIGKKQGITAEALFNFSNEEIKSFLIGAINGDGSISNRKGGGIVALITGSKLTAETYKLLLRKIGIISHIRALAPGKNSWSQNNSYQVCVTGRENMSKLMDLRLEPGRYNNLQKIMMRQSLDEKIPHVEKLISDVNTQLPHGSHHLLYSNGIKVSQLKNGMGVCRNTLRKAVEALASFIILPTAMNILKNVAVNELFFGTVVQIREIPAEPVYNLQTDAKEDPNYIANFIPIHNCCIDEMDKMTKEDGWAMHEALEQQSVTISKANIQASLRCETTVLAAANPKFGRFDPYDTVANQINLAPTLINRFDLIFPIKDIPDTAKDEKMAQFILEMHKQIKLVPDIDTKLLRKYLAYARQNVFPKLTDVAIDELREYYIKMRSSSSGAGIKSVPISARQLEGLVRLSEASAKIRLSDKVNKKDARVAIELLDHCLRQIAMDEKTGTFDIDRIATDTPAASRNKIIVIKEIINTLEAKVGKAIPVEDLIKAAGEEGVVESEVEELLQKLKRAGDIFEPKRGFVSKI